MTEERRSYISYLLRLWQIKDPNSLVWRASLESPSSGERWGFGSLDELWRFLQQQTQRLDPARQPTDDDHEHKKGGTSPSATEQ